MNSYTTHPNSSIRLARAAPLGILVFLASCAIEAPRELEYWSSDRHKPCQSLTFEYTTEATALAEIIGSIVKPFMDSESQGRLNVVVLTCQSAMDQALPAEARVTVALNEHQLPLQMAGSTFWNAYVLHIADQHTPGRRLMEDSQVAILSAGVWLTTRMVDHSLVATARLEFVDGDVVLNASFDCVPQEFVRRGMLIGTGDRYTVITATESGKTCIADDFSHNNNGLTPFSDISLESVSAEWTTDLQWKYTLWRGVTRNPKEKVD